MGLGERVKPQLSQALIKGAHPDSNSRPAVQISSPLVYFLFYVFENEKYIFIFNINILKLLKKYLKLSI
jgi:hypothetical protein